MSWIYLLIASLFEIAWLYSLKYLDWTKIKNISGWVSEPIYLLPLIGYVGFGIGNVVFYAWAMKTIPASTAFAVWLGVALLGSKLIDTFYFGEPINVLQISFLGLILAGIIGLQFSK
jgi:quaternary ammonium compound-resistance protein SugE